MLLARLLIAGPRHAVLWLRGAPRWLQAAVAVIVLAGVGVGGYYVVHTRAAGQKARATTDAWKQFDAAAKAGDEPAMRAALDEVLVAAPGDPLAVRRKAAVEKLDADPADPPMLALTLRMALKANNADAVAREAAKQITLTPGDWLARLVRARAALTTGDRAAATKELDALAPPDHPDARLDTGTLLLAFRLFRAAGRDVAPLRAIVQSRVLPFLRTATAQNMPPSDKAGLVECYLEAFEPAADQPQPPRVAQAWAGAASLADLAAEQAVEAGNVVALVRLGRAAVPLSAALRNLRRHDQVTEQQFADLNRELEDRTRKVWEAVRAKEPTNPDAFRGLALMHLRASNPGKAWDLVTQGLAEAGDDPELALLFSRMLQIAGQPKAAWAVLAERAKNNPGKVIWWAMAAEAAVVAHDRGLALDACAQVRAADPNNRWAARTEGRLWVEAGYPAKAVEVLAKFGDDTVARDPLAGRTFARALTEAGDPGRAEAFLAKAEQAADDTNAAEPVVAAVRGWAEAVPPTPERAARVAQKADRLLERWPDQPELFRVRAEALARLAELSDPPWDTVRVAAAVQATERLRARLPDDLPAAVALGWLRLYGQNNPEQAARDLAPLFAVEAAADRTAAELELLGAVYRRTGKIDDALRVLARGVRAADANAGCLTQMALALHARGQTAQARAALAEARAKPRSPREQADYVAAVRLIQP